MQSKYTRLWNFVVTDPKSTNPRDFGILLTPLLSLLRHGKELPWIRTECVIDTVQASSSRALQISKTKGLVCIGSSDELSKTVEIQSWGPSDDWASPVQGTKA